MSHSVTLELPDPLYKKLRARTQQTSRSIEDELLTSVALDLPVLPTTETPIVQAYNELMDFLASGPTPGEITEFCLPVTVMQRAQFLLDKGRTQALTDAEEQELDAHVALGDFLGILRAKAQLKLHSSVCLFLLQPFQRFGYRLD